MCSQLDYKIIDRIIQDEMQEMKIPGLAIAIVSKTEAVYIKGFGKANVSGARITEKTPFFIGSSSKSFTAMAIMQLSEAKALDIDEPVIKYLPKFQSIKNASEITIRQLLNHTSGFSTYEGMKMYNGKAGETLSQFSKNLKNIKLSRKPGTSHEYSNINYVILGLIVEMVSGLTYENYIVNKIFKPLGMDSSFADYQKALNYGLEKGYQPVLGLVRQTNYEFHPEAIPAGYLVSCAEDMAKYLIANLNGGSYKNTSILSEDGMNMLHTKSSETSEHYGLGWFDYGELVHHGGNTENYHTNMMLLPSRGLGIVILYNINDNLSKAFTKGSFGKGETVVYDRIQSRILNALTRQEMVSPVITGIKGFYKKVNMISLAIFALATVYGVAVLSGSFTNIFMLLLLNAVIPIALLIALPRLFKATWKSLFRFTKGFSHVLFALQLYLMLIGVLKLIFM